MRNWFRRLRLAYKLALGFGVSIALTVLVLFTAVTGTMELRAQIHNLSDDALTGQTALFGFSTHAAEARMCQYRLTGYNGKEASDIANQVDQQMKLADDALMEYKKTVNDDVDSKNFNAVDADWKEYESVWAANRKQLIDLEQVPAFKLLEQLTQKLYVERLRADLDKTVDWNSKSGVEAGKTADSAATAIKQKSITIGLFAVLVAGLFGWLITRAITTPITSVSAGLNSLRDNCAASLQTALRALAGGDLTVNLEPVTNAVKVTSEDEAGLMAASFNDSLASIQEAIKSYNLARLSLSSLVARVAESANAVSSTSQTLAAAAEESTASSTEIASGSDKLAVSASASAATMSQVAGRVQEVSDGSESQSQLIAEISASIAESNLGLQSVTASAREMANTAQEGNLAVTETVAAMGRVKMEVERSTERVKELDMHGQEIGKIVEAIEQIAQQTNLLALNAAIEAARAGEHGRGFAVVADEVRKLAEQSSVSTQQIGDLISTVRNTVSDTVTAIERAQAEVSEGSQKSEMAGNSLCLILNAAQAVLEQNESVATISNSIAQSITDIAASAAKNRDAATEMMSGSTTVLESIESVASVSEEAAAGAQQLTASVEEVGRAAGELAQMSQELQGIVMTFKFEDEKPSAANTRLRIAA